MGIARERDESGKVVCRCCGQSRNLIHWSHLRIHGYLNQEQYRREFGIPDNVPLTSEDLSAFISQIGKENTNSDRARRMGSGFQQARNDLMDMLCEVGYYTPFRASRLTGIPVTTIQSALQYGRIQTYWTDNPSRRDQMIKLVSHYDLYDFQLRRSRT